MKTESCIGCAIETEITDGPIHKYLLSSSGCWAKFGEILAREYENFEYMSVHALTVDAYALQHPGIESPQTISSVYVHLASLYSYFELKAPIAELSKIKQGLTKYKNQFKWLEPPENVTDITVAYVLESDSAAQHREAVLKWAKYVYDRWELHHAEVASFL